MNMKQKIAAIGGVGALPLFLAHKAHAALPADVTTALGDMKDDGVSAATLVIVAVIAVAAILFLRKAVR